MVGRWGMSDAVGPMVTQPSDSETALLSGAEASPDTQRLVDREVRRILADAHRDVTTLLTEHRENLDTLAHALLEHETLDGRAAYRAAGQAPPGARETATPTATDAAADV
jgi:cell division protease FtsH